VKGSNSVAKLVMKHAILTTIVNSNKTWSSWRQIARLLNVHPLNVTKAIQHQKLMNSSREFLWTLSIHNKRSNMLSLATKVVVFAWWYFEMCMSSNRKEVVRKHLVSHVYDIKLAQYLLETLVLSTLSLFYSTFIV
jgi:hypothetical protein